MPRPKTNPREGQQSNQASGSWGWSVLSSLALLQWLWAAADVRCNNKAEESALAQRTRIAAVDCLLGGYCCEACRAKGILTIDRLEGHHVENREMYLSDYRHCITQKFRRRALQKLIEEVRQRMRLLCKTCHEMAHHAPQRSVQQGIYVHRT